MARPSLQRVQAILPCTRWQAPCHLRGWVRALLLEQLRGLLEVQSSQVMPALRARLQGACHGHTYRADAAPGSEATQSRRPLAPARVPGHPHICAFSLQLHSNAMLLMLMAERTCLA